MRVLVCGGRDFDDFNFVWHMLESFHLSNDGPISVLIHGAARGADTAAARWGQSEPSVRVVAYPADWKKHGKAAGPIRNKQMLDEGKPDLVIAFPGGKGTEDMVRRAKAIGVRVLRNGWKSA